MLVIIGVLIGLASAVAFMVIGALALFGGVDATQKQVVPGFRPERPGPLQRTLTLLGLWAPIVFVATLCLLGAIQILQVSLRAIL
jgi:hypothetical protein